MDINLPPHLEIIRQMLASSLRIRPSEPAPAVPCGLLEDINRRFATQRYVIEPTRNVSFVQRLRSLVQTPAFGLAAAAVFVLAVVGPSLVPPHSSLSGSTFRGTMGETSSPVWIVIIDGPAEISNFLMSSGDFESTAFVTVGSYDSALSIEGAKVVLDFEHSVLRSHDSDGKVIHTADLPTSLADLPLSISTAVSRF